MSAQDDLQRAIEHAFRGRLKTPRTWPALLGDVAGVVDTPNRAGWVNVVMPDGSSASAYNGGRVPPVAGLPVVVGYDYLNSALFAVLAVRQNYQDGTPYPAGIGAHAATHEWLQPNGGYDVVYSDARQLLPLRLDVAGMVVTVHAGYAMTETGWTLAAGQSLDLTASVPGSGAKWALLTLDETGALTSTLGSDGGSRLLLGPGQLPDLPDHHRPLAGVKLYAGQTEIVESLTQQDLVDLRFAAPYTILPVPTVDGLQFNTSGSSTSVEGLLQWDGVNGTAQLGMPGGNVTLQLGQEQIVRVQNDSGGALADGDLVYVSGASGTNIRVKKAKADAESTSANTLGMVTEAIASNQHGYVTTFGVVHGLNTNGLTAGAILYLSPTTAGGWTTTKPTAPNHTVTVGVVLRVSATEGEIFVSINNGYELEEMHDVAISGSAAGDLLIAGSAGTWSNHPLTGDASLSSGGALTIVNGAVTFAKMAALTGLSVIGTSGSASATPQALTAGSVGQVLRRASSGSSLAFGAVDLASANAVTGVLPVANGGTGGSSLSAAGLAQGAGTLTATTSNDATLAAHTHAVTSSSNPGAAARILATDASGYLQLARLGIGVSPTSALMQVYGDTDGEVGYWAQNANTSGSKAAVVHNILAGSTIAQLVSTNQIYSHAGGYGAIASSLQIINRSGPLVFKTGGYLDASARMYISSTGNVLIGTINAPSGGGTPVMALGRAASSPTGGPADAALLYTKNLTSGSGTAVNANGAICMQAVSSTYEYELGRHAKLPGGQQVAVRTVTANYTAQDSDYVLLCSGGSAGITVTLPAAANVGSANAYGAVFHIKKVDSATGTVTVSGNGATIDGATTQVIRSQYTSMQIVCDGSNWHII